MKQYTVHSLVTSALFAAGLATVNAEITEEEAERTRDAAIPGILLTVEKAHNAGVVKDGAKDYILSRLSSQIFESPRLRRAQPAARLRALGNL